ncbi:peptidoglycan DD-metalloendopeptidase family protein [Epilithonimonas caeni]|uniref:peptidoglycan DD-metalloendopeptidase family protein n=1 Tax=Epilithonimonas caeni TaxID=365343 RepID=UPI000415FA8C|nr:peptidoglycan DD-metalloendopeptidase family protein [Epilithonimonas caeni]
MAKGVKSVKGNTLPKVGETTYYEVSSYYNGTVVNNENDIKWKLYVQEDNGSWRELKGPLKTGRKVPYTLPEKWYGKKMLIEAYLKSPEKKTPPGLIIMPVPGKRNIESIVFFDSNWKPLKDIPKYGQSVNVRINTTNMFGETLKVSLWERDTVSSTGHDASSNVNIWGTEKSYKVNNTKGVVEFSMILDPAWRIKAGASPFEGLEHEYYLLVKGYGAATKYSVQRDVKDEVIKQESVKAKGFGTNPPPENNGKSPAIVKRNDQEKKKNEKNNICECEAKIRAFMRMLRVKEGTEKEIGYTTQYSGKQFSDMSKHPEEVIKAGGYSSSAAGAYQIMTDTWKNLTGYYQGKDKKWHYSEKIDLAKKYNISSFDQESQDRFCLAIMKHNYLQDRSDSFYNPTIWKNKEKKIHDTVKEDKAREWRKRFKGQQGDIIQMIIDDDIKRAALISSLCWASLPDSPYGQQSSAYTFEAVKAIYEKYLKEELVATSKDLHLKKGFLKEFGYGCCGGGAKDTPVNLDSKCSEDCSQCFEYSDVIPDPKINDQSGNKNHNRYKNEPRTKANGKKYYHSGTDILAVVGTEVHSMMCGEVVHIRTDLPQNDYVKGYESPTSYGNTITIKSKDKEGKTVYHFYAHLSKVNVKVGELVKHDKVIGLSGSTGNAMHVEVKHRHVHVEAGTSYSTTGGTNGKQRCKINADLNPENYMKSKFDNKGNTL